MHGQRIACRGLTCAVAKLTSIWGAWTLSQGIYVAATRFKRADDVIILQPFDIKIFQKGAPDQPQLLMRHLAGEDISDGLAALDKKIKEQTAAQKQQKKQRANQNRSATQKRNWEGMTADERQRRAPKPRQDQGSTETVVCSTCGKHKSNKTDDGYAKSQWKKRKTPGAQLECKQCIKYVTCDQCGESKGHAAYTRHDWEHRRKAPITCTACVQCHLRV